MNYSFSLALLIVTAYFFFGIDTVISIAFFSVCIYVWLSLIWGDK